MKSNYLIRSLPLFSTLLLIIILSVSNQKENTKLRILIWNTPSLALGTYLAISSGTGFILSYFMTTNLAKRTQTKQQESRENQEERINEMSNEYTETTSKTGYDNTLIERDIKHPSPTIDASFRIIGRKERENKRFINNNSNDDYSSIENEENYDEQTDKYDTYKKVKTISSDWNDESYSSW